MRLNQRFRLEIFTLIFILAVFCAQESLWPSGEEPNFLLVSGAATTLLFVWAAKNIFGEVENTLRRLVKRRALLMKQSDLEEFVLHLRHKSNMWGVVGGLTYFIGASILFYHFQAFNGFKDASQSILSVLASFIGGRYSGEMLCFGFLGRFLRKENATISTKPRHVDGAAGLKPIGDYYLLEYREYADMASGYENPPPLCAK